MKKYTGWLFDVYAHPEKGIVLWLIGEDGRRYSFRQEFPVTFYVGGPFHRLRQLWQSLSIKPVTLCRTQREDLYAGTKDVMEVRVPSPALFAGMFKEINQRFPDLNYFDVDIPLILRYAAAHRVFPLARCQVTAKKGWNITKVISLDTPWELDANLPALRTLHLKPDVDPSHAKPKYLQVNFHHFKYRLSLESPRELLIRLNSVLRQYDPDVILTSFGDTWLFTYLEELSHETEIPFNPNRDLSRSVTRRKEVSFHNYGQAHYRGERVHLTGRWHIDEQNCMTFSDYGLSGAIEQARMTGLPVQEIARRSPGAGISAMQTLTALRRGVLVPYQNQKGEVTKTYSQLFASDRGGLVFAPLLGIYQNVAIIDFISMYPSIMVEYNISPETVGADEEDAWQIPDLDIKVSPRLGLVPETLKPMRDKRVAIKRLLKTLDRNDPRYRNYKAFSKALKWLSVVAYGRLGYANSTFGRINAHEAVTHIGRMSLLRAKEIVEDHGFVVLHVYVDSLFVYHPDAAHPVNYQPLLDEIERETRLPIEVEAVYSWMAFVSARHKSNVAVANRFFGLLPDGSYKIRGLAVRRSDTSIFVSKVQAQILQILASERDPRRLAGLLPNVLSMLWERISALSKREVPLGELIINQTLSRELNEYRVASPVARAALQLQTKGKVLRMGQQVRFIYAKTDSGVFAWDLADNLDPRVVDNSKYKELLFHAVYEVLQPMGVTRNILRNWMFGRAGYIQWPSLIDASKIERLSLPLFAGVNNLRADIL